MKKKYFKPSFSITKIFLESGILEGSGIAIFSDEEGTVNEEWIQQIEDRDIDW